MHFNLYKDLPTHLNSAILLQLIICLCAISSVMYSHTSLKDSSLQLCGSLHFRYTWIAFSCSFLCIAAVAVCYTELAILAPLLRADLRQIFTLTDPTVGCRNKHKTVIGEGGVAAASPHHHVAVTELGHLLNRSVLTHPVVSSVVFPGSFKTRLSWS